jgi:hypothetical protein
MNRKSAVEAMERNASSQGRRTRPEDVGPASPEKIRKLYEHGEKRLHGGTKGDGLVSAAAHARESKLYMNQSEENSWLPEGPGAPRGYLNDVPENSWLRGGGKEGAGHPGFDSGPVHGSRQRGNTNGKETHLENKKQSSGRDAGGLPNTASGSDLHQSPFSRAAASRPREASEGYAGGPPAQSVGRQRPGKYGS